MQPHLPCKLFDPARSGPPLACKASALLTELATQNLSLFVGADTGASLFGMASPVRIFPGCTILWRGRDYYTSPYPLERTWWREMDLNHQDLDGARQADPLRPRGGGGQDDGGRRVEELPTVVLADPEDVEAHLVGELHLVEEVVHPLDRAQGDPGDRVRDGGGKAVDSNLHAAPSRWLRRFATHPAPPSRPTDRA